MRLSAFSGYHMTVKAVKVSGIPELEKSVTSYLNQGFTLASRTSLKATLQKNKPPLSAAIIILGLIIPILGWGILLVYMIIRLMTPASQVVEISVREE